MWPKVRETRVPGGNWLRGRPRMRVTQMPIMRRVRVSSAPVTGKVMRERRAEIKVGVAEGQARQKEAREGVSEVRAERSVTGVVNAVSKAAV